MEETPTSPILLPPKDPDHAVAAMLTPIAITRLGVMSLALMFVASMIVTTSYLQYAQANPQTQAMPAKAQMAAAATSIPHPAITLASSTLQAHAAYVLDLTTGETLYSYNADAQLPLASITKVPLTLAVSEVIAPNTRITIPEDTAPPGSLERLAKGDVWLASDVIDFTLAASSNAGASILAQEANDSLHAKYPQSPADHATLWRMNDLAKQLNLSKTYFLNVSGLDISTTQAGAFGSAHDVAQLMAYAATTSPEVFAATTQPSFSLLSLNGAKTMAVNTDKALDAIPGIIMGKTGYTDLAGGNLAVVFNGKPGHPVVAVVLGSTEQGRFDDMKRIVAAVQENLDNI